MNGKPAGTDGRRPRATGVGLGLATLVVLTTAAVAWVSIWWVPAYLALMVLIFVTPQGHRQLLLATERAEVSANAVPTDLAKKLRIDSAAAGECTHLGVAPTLDLAVGESPTEVADLRADLASYATTKPRRGRSRARRVAKMATELLPESAPATWIRIGPGKFVRADVHVHTVDKAPTEDPLADLRLLTSASVEVMQGPTAPAVVGQEQLPLERLDLTLDDEGIATASADLMRRSVTEENGITPSTFGPVLQVSTSVDGLEDDVFGVAVELEADPLAVASLDVKASGHSTDRERLGSPERTLRSHVGRVPRRVANAISDEDRVSARRIVRNGPRHRTLIRSSFVPNTRFQQAARRAFGRLPHFERTLRPRSPPDC